MRDTDLAFRHLIRANPVPDPASFREELQLNGDEKGTAMSNSMTTTTKTLTPQRKKMRGWIPVTAILTVVLLIGIPVTVTDGFGLFGSREMSPQELAEAYMDARNARDSDRILELLSSDAKVMDTLQVVDLSELPLFLEIERQFEYEYSPYECEVNPDNEDVVICSYQIESRMQRVQGIGPASGEIWIYTRNGEITLTSQDIPDRVVAAWESFGRFLDGQGVFYDIYRGDERGPILTPEAVALHGEYFDLWAQRRGG